MDTQPEEKKPSNLERHVQTILLTLITATIIGGFTKISNISETIVRMEEREKIKGEIFSSMQGDFKSMQGQLNAINDRLTKLESRK